MTHYIFTHDDHLVIFRFNTNSSSRFLLNVSNLNNKANIISSFYYITVRYLCLPKV